MPLFWYSGRTASGATAKDVWTSLSETISTFVNKIYPTNSPFSVFATSDSSGIYVSDLFKEFAIWTVFAWGVVAVAGIY